MDVTAIIVAGIAAVGSTLSALFAAKNRRNTSTGNGMTIAELVSKVDASVDRLEGYFVEHVMNSDIHHNVWQSGDPERRRGRMDR